MYQSPLNAIRWLAFINNSGETIPAFAPLRVTGASIVSGAAVITVAKPNADSLEGCPLNGPESVASGKYGRCTFDAWWATHNTANTPAAGESWGVENAQWRLKKGNTGFLAIGGATGSGGAARALFSRKPTAPVLGKTDAAHAKGDSGTVSIWAGTPGSETDTTLDVVAYNRFANVGSGKWVWLNHNGDGWYLVAAEC